MIGRIDHVMMWAENLEAAARWYQEKLGFEISYLAPGEFLSMHQEKMGRLDFHAAGGDKTQVGRGPMPYFVVEDIEKTKAWLEGKGIQVPPVQQVGESPKHTWFKDLEGNVLGLEEY